MDFGCHLPVFGPMATRDNLLAFARRAEALGYDSLWVSDHVVVPTAIASRYPYNASGRLFIAADAALIELDTRYRDLEDLVAIYERFAREIRPALA